MADAPSTPKQNEQNAFIPNDDASCQKKKSKVYPSGKKYKKDKINGNMTKKEKKMKISLHSAKIQPSSRLLELFVIDIDSPSREVISHLLRTTSFAR